MRNSCRRVAPAGFGQALPSVIREFFGSVNCAICGDPEISGDQYTRAFGSMYWISFVIV